STQRIDLELKLIATSHALQFCSLQDDLLAFSQSTSRKIETYVDKDEYRQWKKLGDEVLHIQLRNWADLLLIAPLSANTLGKIANGLCDNLLTCVLRAWDYRHKPCLVAPAMNTAMYLHPITNIQLNLLTSWGIHIIPPISKKLACGEIGIGALAEPMDIADTLFEYYQRHVVDMNGSPTQHESKEEKEEQQEEDPGQTSKLKSKNHPSI
ncbi:hypothetical protein HMI54_011373, partial [Coelomomyces lativittatus]